jgi:hypothetical protein
VVQITHLTVSIAPLVDRERLDLLCLRKRKSFGVHTKGMVYKPLSLPMSRCIHLLTSSSPDKAVRLSPWPGIYQSNTNDSSHTRAIGTSESSSHLLRDTSRGPHSAEQNTPTPDTPTASSVHDETPSKGIFTELCNIPPD